MTLSHASAPLVQGWIRLWLLLIAISLTGCADWEEDIQTFEDSPCAEGAEVCIRFTGPYYPKNRDGCIYCSINNSTVRVNIRDHAGRVVGTSGAQPWDEFDPNGEGKILCIQGLPGEILLTFEVTVECPQTTDQAGLPCGKATFKSLDNAKATLACGYRDIVEIPLYGR